jgi:hypothetical protein
MANRIVVDRELYETILARAQERDLSVAQYLSRLIASSPAP